MTGQQIVVSLIFENEMEHPQHIISVLSRASNKEIDSRGILSKVKKSFHRKINRKYLDSIKIINFEDEVAYGFGISKIFKYSNKHSFVPILVEIKGPYINLVDLSSGQIKQEKLWKQ